MDVLRIGKAIEMGQLPMTIDNVRIFCEQSLRHVRTNS
jgi:hypothetical protein